MQAIPGWLRSCIRDFTNLRVLKCLVCRKTRRSEPIKIKQASKEKQKQTKKKTNKKQKYKINKAKIVAFIRSKTFNRLVIQELSCWFNIPLISSGGIFSCSFLSRICRTGSRDVANFYICCLCLDNSLKSENEAVN